LNAITLNKIK